MGFLASLTSGERWRVGWRVDPEVCLTNGSPCAARTIKRHLLLDAVTHVPSHRGDNSMFYILPNMVALVFDITDFAQIPALYASNPS